MENNIDIKISATDKKAAIKLLKEALDYIKDDQEVCGEDEDGSTIDVGFTLEQSELDNPS